MYKSDTSSMKVYIYVCQRRQIAYHFIQLSNEMIIGGFSSCNFLYSAKITRT